MIKLASKMKVVQMHLRGDSNRKIARELGMDRKTVGKYVVAYESAQAAVTAPGRRGRDAIAEQVLAQIKFIGAVGRSVA